MMIIKLSEIKQPEIDLIAGYLAAGKVIIYPTDTIYGLGCSAIREKAVRKINRIKGRSARKGYIILVNSLAMAKKYAEIDKGQEVFLKSVWPGPVTVILKSKNKLSASVAGQDGTIAIRLPNNDFISMIIGKLGLPLISTSVNGGGQPAIFDPAAIVSFLKQQEHQPAIFIDAGISRRHKPSKLIDIRADKIKILRK
jgi:L-threonylcarbamoyladenylate synthase